MKKLISLLTALAVVSACSFGAFAADFDTTQATTEVPFNEDTQQYEVTATATNQATILAVKGDTISVGNAIQFIDQATVTKANSTDATGTHTFAFALNEDLLAKASTIADTKIYVLTGGDGTINVAGYIETAESSTPTTFKVYGYVADKEATVYLGDANQKVTQVDTQNVGSYSFEELEAGEYSLIIKAPGAFSRTVPVTVADADVLVADLAGATTLVYGDADGNDLKVEFADLSLLLDAYRKYSNEIGYTLNCDFDRNGRVEFADLSLLLDAYRKTIDEAYAE